MQRIVATVVIAWAPALAVWAQTPEISITAHYGATAPLARGMNARNDSFATALSSNHVVERYPFGDPNTSQFALGLRGGYRFANSPWSLIAGVARTTFSTEDTTPNYAHMGIWSFLLGGEWTAGTRENRINAFFRGAMAINLVNGDFAVPSVYEAKIAPTIRAGFEMGGGVRFNLKNTPLAIELAADYTHVNLVGRSFARPNAAPGAVETDANLNDAADPATSTDTGRTIDFVSIHGGMQIML